MAIRAKNQNALRKYGTKDPKGHSYIYDDNTYNVGVFYWILSHFVIVL